MAKRCVRDIVGAYRAAGALDPALLRDRVLRDARIDRRIVRCARLGLLEAWIAWVQLAVGERWLAFAAGLVLSLARGLVAVHAARACKRRTARSGYCERKPSAGRNRAA